jgi:DNA primase
MDNWVDFRLVKQVVTMHKIIDHYNINWLRKSGKEFRGRCPIHHRGAGESGEDKNGASFHINHDKNAFNCFSCKARGNVIDFVAAMERCSVRDAALKLKEWFGVSDDSAAKTEHGGGVASKKAEVVKAASEPTESADEKRGTPVGESSEQNKPLAFELKAIDPTHAYIAERGIKTETAQRFGIGFFPGRGSMSGRVVVPIHNVEGELVAYSGRSIDGTEPKYKLPAGFQKSKELFNFHRAAGEDEKLVILVEGFFDTMALHQAGFTNTVALMGCQLSSAQEQLLTSRFNDVIILLDGDEAGRTAAREIAARLVTQLFVRVVDLKTGEQPDRMTADALRELLNGVL